MVTLKSNDGIKKTGGHLSSMQTITIPFENTGSLRLLSALQNKTAATIGYW